MSWNHQMLFEKSEFKSCTTGENTVVQIFMRNRSLFILEVSMELHALFVLCRTQKEIKGSYFLIHIRTRKKLQLLLPNICIGYNAVSTAIPHPENNSSISCRK